MVIGDRRDGGGRRVQAAPVADSGVEMTTEIGRGQDSPPASGTVAPGDVGGPAWMARLQRLEGRERRMIVVGVELAALARYLTSRRFVGAVIVGVVGVRALATLGKESQTRTVARVVAWDKARIQRELKAAEHRRRGGRRRQKQG
jgi:hypothetical protein